MRQSVLSMFYIPPLRFPVHFFSLVLRPRFFLDWPPFPPQKKTPTQDAKTSQKDTMAEPRITNRDDVMTSLLYGGDGDDGGTLQAVKYSCWVSDSVHGGDALYMGTIQVEGDDNNKPPSDSDLADVHIHSLEQIQMALSRVAADRVFPPLPFPWWMARTVVTVADDWDAEPRPDLYLKRPWITHLDVDAAPGESPSSVAVWFAHEVKQLERLARAPGRPHPNLVRYHGCRVRNGRVTGILLGHVPGRDLFSHLQDGGTVDREPFFAALASAIDHLHNIVGLVHNDISPGNVMVGPDGAPTLIDLGSAFPDGEEIVGGVPFECWGDDPLDMDPETHFVGPSGGPVSRKSRDMAALNHLRTWIDNPIEETTGRRRRNEMAVHFVEVGNRLKREAAARQEAAAREV